MVKNNIQKKMFLLFLIAVVIYVMGIPFHSFAKNENSNDLAIMSGEALEVSFTGGRGTPDDPYLITKIEELQLIGGNQESLNKHYKLMENLDFNNKDSYMDIANMSVFTTGKGFKPIGDIEAMDFDPNVHIPFSGSFDGNNKTIANLYINRAIFDPDNITEGGITVGLFGGVMGSMNSPVIIKDLELLSPNITGANRVGALAAAAMFTKFENCKISGGTVKGTAFPSAETSIEDFVGRTTSTGGMLGMTYVKGSGIYHCSSSATVYGTDAVGGLVGYNYGNEIKDSFSTGDITGDQFIGGLAGCNIGTAMKMGGMPPIYRFIYSKIENCYASGAVTGNRTSSENGVGGLVGYNHVFAQIRNTYSTGEVIGKQNTGGLVGHNNLGTIENSYTTSNVTGSTSVGGLVGLHQKKLAGGTMTTTHGAIIIRNCIAFNQNVLSSDNFNIGKIVGMCKGEDVKVNHCYTNVDMNISEQGDHIESGIEISNEIYKDLSFYKNLVNWDTENGGMVWNFSKIWIMGEKGPIFREKEDSSDEQPTSTRRKRHSKNDIVLPISPKDLKNLREINIKDNSKITPEFFELIKQGMDIDFTGNFYSYHFNGNNDVDRIDSDFIDLGVSILSLDEGKWNTIIDKDTVNIRFNHKSEFPSKAKITLQLKDNLGKETFVYRYDEDTNRLVIIGLFKTGDGVISFEIDYGGDYILSDFIIPEKDIYIDEIDDIAYVRGYKNGRFEPDKFVTRAETATILSNLLKAKKFSDNKTFSDINMWAKNDILKIESLGYISGYPDGTFRPNSGISRAEFVRIIVNIFNVENIESYKNVQFTDIENCWAKKEIEICYKLGIVSGNGNKFRPNDKITRAEAVSIINRLIHRNSIKKENPYYDLSKNHWAYDEIMSASDNFQ
ncbi:S-layer homology domain-containing protein [Anaerovorax sp. IOR16]|uniref:S-layer homology domain-containing protein n=1 Tax=Anaerovorax sp. IOR16 TaxID=2773458 RepID=UPI0019D1B27B|nr:S-layer homology domain-containing protein [Anaerovorax sp. IOR16]